MPALKCPNPSCPFLFDPAQVPPGAMLTCPRCQLKFTLAASEPPPFLLADAPAADAPAADSPAPRSAGFPVVAIVLGSVAAVAAVVGVVFGVSALRQATRVPPPPAGPPVMTVADKNFSYTPPAGWALDPQAKDQIGANALAMSRAEPPAAHVALSVIDYDDRSPDPGELRAEMNRSLNRVFASIPAELPLSDTTWAGQPALKTLFRGEDRATNEPRVGEVYLMHHQGVGYWFYSWTAEADAAKVAADLESARGGFKLLSGRGGWKPKLEPETTYRSVKNNSLFKLTSRDPFWAPVDGIDPAGENPAGELFLKGKLRAKRRDFAPEAFVLVSVLPAAGDPAKQAEAFVRARYTPDAAAFGPTAITPVTTPVETPPGVTATRFKVHVGGDAASNVADKLVVFTHATAGEKLVVADASCDWKQRESWEPRLVRFLGTLAPAGAK